MGLFQRQTMSDSIPLYTLGQSNVKLIVGLGNIGDRYSMNRHNIGFLCLEHFARKNNGTWIEQKNLKGLVCSVRIGNSQVVLLKPTTMMNLSGEAVQSVQHFYKIKNADTLVVHDELDIQFGQIRTRLGGSSAGNNGIKSVITHCNEDFARAKIGIGPKHPDQMDSADFVLQNFNSYQQTHLKDLYNEVDTIITDFVYSQGIAHDTRQFIF
jgi:PTH1 family peptidyl-tRNA hydrolase